MSEPDWDLHGPKRGGRLINEEWGERMFGGGPRHSTIGSVTNPERGGPGIQRGISLHETGEKNRKSSQERLIDHPAEKKKGGNGRFAELTEKRMVLGLEPSSKKEESTLCPGK